MDLFSSWLYVSVDILLTCSQKLDCIVVLNKTKTKNPKLLQDKTSNCIKRQIGTPNTPMSDMLLSWLGTVTSIKIGTSFMFYLGI
jgi:hypothetical protein